MIIGACLHCGYTMSEIHVDGVSIQRSLAVTADLGAGVGVVTEAGPPGGGRVTMSG